MITLKRYYDNALTTSPSAHLPVHLALMKLWVKMWFLEDGAALNRKRKVMDRRSGMLV
jgi:hypothetical protein